MTGNQHVNNYCSEQGSTQGEEMATKAHLESDASNRKKKTMEIVCTSNSIIYY